ncbi:MAG: small multi-drug export protein [Clostridia bacterium]
MNTAFIWSEHLGKIATTALLSMVPTFEGRYAISVGMSIGMPMVFTFLLALVFSTLPMPFIFWFLKPILKWLYALPIKPLQKFAAWVERRSLKKGSQMDTTGLLSLFVFVAVPLPGTGVWTGSAIATLLNMKKSHSMVAIFLGNVVACLIMTLLTSGVLHFF